MELTIKHRVILLGMSAAFTGNVVALGKIQRFREALSLSSEESKAVNFRDIQGGYKWDEPDEGNPRVKEIEVPERAMELITKALMKMDETEVLTLDHMDLYGLFVPDDSSNGNHPGEAFSEEVKAS